MYLNWTGLSQPVLYWPWQLCVFDGGLFVSTGWNVSGIYALDRWQTYGNWRKRTNVAHSCAGENQLGIVIEMTSLLHKMRFAWMDSSTVISQVLVGPYIITYDYILQVNYVGGVFDHTVRMHNTKAVSLCYTYWSTAVSAVLVLPHNIGEAAMFFRMLQIIALPAWLLLILLHDHSGELRPIHVVDVLGVCTMHVHDGAGEWTLMCVYPHLLMF